MPVILRISLLSVAVILILWGIGLLTQDTRILTYWLWPDAPWLSHVFMASVFFASAGSYVYCSIFKRLAALRAASLSGVISYGGCSMYLLLQSTQSTQTYDQGRLLMWGEIALFLLIINVLFFIVSCRGEFHSRKEFPGLLKGIMGLVVVANLWVGLRLIANTDAFAWVLAPEMAIIYGWILLGAAIYTVLILLEPYWENIGGLFLAFLGYDLVLIFPLIYLLFYPETAPVHFARVVVYFILVLLTLLTTVCYSIKAFRSVFQNRNSDY